MTIEKVTGRATDIDADEHNSPKKRPKRALLMDFEVLKGLNGQTLNFLTDACPSSSFNKLADGKKTSFKPLNAF